MLIVPAVFGSRRALGSGPSSPPPPPPPPTFSGRTALFDPDDITGFNDDDRLDSWDDSAGSIDLTSSGGFRPTYKTNVLNGYPVVRFGGGSEVMTRVGVARADLWGTETATVYAVIKQDGTEAGNTLFHHVLGSERVLIHPTFSDNKLYFDMPNFTTGRVSVDQPAGWDDAWHVLTCVRSSGNAKIIVDGVELVSASVSGALGSGSGDFGLGALGSWSTGFKGDVAYVSLHNVAHDATEIADSEAVLTDRFGL